MRNSRYTETRGAMRLVKSKTMTREEAIAQAYPPLTRYEKYRDEQALEESRKKDKQLDDAIMEMWEKAWDAFRKCTPDKGGNMSRPRILDVNPRSLMIIPQTCDEDNVRFAIITCHNYNDSPNGVNYTVEINGSGLCAFRGSLEGAIDITKKVIYQEVKQFVK